MNLNPHFLQYNLKIIFEELTPEGDLLPPWQRYPDIKRYSIGWRMGSGEDYIQAWYAWASQLDQVRLLAYFKKYTPIPFAWQDWAAAQLGFRDVSDDIFAGGGEFKGIRWLEEHGLANYAEFTKWYEDISDK
ncbi:MAG: hypothetical protein JEZ00_15345 [Anaerolineaceae bacterium]|nr:hypothetical protein [Anaerolineaceae bacterium]